MAVFGGTFDPFHDGHAQLCERVLEHQEVTQLRLVPCQVPALKQEAQATSQQRLEMLQCWEHSRNYGSKLVVDDRELRRPGPSYTLDTLIELHREFPQWQSVFVLGADAFASLARWQGVEDLIKETHFWVFGRGTQKIEPPALPLTQVSSLSELDGHDAGLWIAGPSSERGWASRDLREDDRQWQYALPKPIQDYIQQQGLYRTPTDSAPR
jgi:nicotinate-nucleotide adenylyltransferase